VYLRIYVYKIPGFYLFILCILFFKGLRWPGRGFCDARGYIIHIRYTTAEPARRHRRRRNRSGEVPRCSSFPSSHHRTSGAHAPNVSIPSYPSTPPQYRPLQSARFPHSAALYMHHRYYRSTAAAAAPRHPTARRAQTLMKMSIFN